MFSKDKVLDFKGKLFNYEELHDLKYKYELEEYQSGEIIDIRTGEISDLENIKLLATSFILDIKREVANSNMFETLDASSKNYVTDYLEQKYHKKFIEKIENNPEEATDEEVIQYWKIKQKVLSDKDIVFSWNMNSFIKLNPNFDLILNFNNSDIGKIYKLIILLTYEDTINVNRESLSECLGVESKSNMREFFKKLEDNEIIYRIDKHSKKNISFVLNPFLAIKGVCKKIDYYVYTMFPKSVEKYMGKLAVRYLMIDNSNLIQGVCEDTVNS